MEPLDTHENDITILRCLLKKDEFNIAFADLLHLGTIGNLIKALTPIEENKDWDEERAAEHARLLEDLKIRWVAERDREYEQGQRDAKERRRDNSRRAAAKARENKTWEKKKATHVLKHEWVPKDPE